MLKQFAFILYILIAHCCLGQTASGSIGFTPQDVPSTCILKGGYWKGEFFEGEATHVYRLTGTIAAKGQYHKSLAVGRWQYSYENGNKKEETDYDSAGRRIYSIFYDNRGKKTQEVYFNKTGSYDGKYLDYDLDGYLSGESEVKNGRTISFITWWHGQIQRAYYFINDSLRIDEHFKNGLLIKRDTTRLK